MRLSDDTRRLLFGNHGVHCLDGAGTELWHHNLREAQHVVVGTFRPDSSLQVAVIDRGYPRTPEGDSADLYLYDLETGREIWKRQQPPGGWVAACLDIRWTGIKDQKEIMVYKRGAGNPLAIYDGDGNILEEIDVPPSICSVYNDNPWIHACDCADVYGDSREEIILAGWKGVRIYANTGPLSDASLYNKTCYHGM